MNPPKDVMFYSKHCPYCSGVLQTLAKNNKREQFMFINVDTNRDKIPRQIDKVPAILLTNGKVLFEDALDRYVQGGVNDVMPAQDVGGSYSFLGSEEESSFQNFALYGSEYDRIQCIEDDKPRKGADADALDRYKVERDKEISRIFNDVPRQ